MTSVPAALSVIDGGAVIQGTKFPLCPGVDLIQKGHFTFSKRGGRGSAGMESGQCRASSCPKRLLADG
jgi:hypothetical protein